MHEIGRLLLVQTLFLVQFILGRNPVAQLLAYRIWKQEVAGSICSSAIFFPRIDESYIIPLSPLVVLSKIVMWESSQWLRKNIVQTVWLLLEDLQESMDRCTNHHDKINVEISIKHHTIYQPISVHIFFLALLLFNAFPNDKF